MADDPDYRDNQGTPEAMERSAPGLLAHVPRFASSGTSNETGNGKDDGTRSVGSDSSPIAKMDASSKESTISSGSLSTHSVRPGQGCKDGRDKRGNPIYSEVLNENKVSGLMIAKR